MIIKTIYYTGNFIKKWRKLSSQEKKQFKSKIALFQINPFTSNLKTHKLKGKLANFWSFSLNFQQRVLLDFKTKGKAIFYDFGGHEIYK